MENITRIIILGDSGYIGGSLKNSLNEKFPDIETLGFSFPEVDLTKNNDALQLSQYVIPGTVIVMCSGIKKQYGDSLEIFEQNLKMVINVCKNLLSDNLLRFLFVSSAEVYGEDPNDLFITEKTQAAPTSYYGMAKYISELIIKKSLAAYPKTSYIILRPALIFGPGEEASFYGPSGFMKAAVNNQEIVLWGDGSELREFVYINDLIFVVNGPGQLATFMPDCSYIMMNALPEGSIVTTENFIKNRGMEVGENYRWATPDQRQIFKPDTYENIIFEFERFVEEFGNRDSVEG